MTRYQSWHQGSTYICTATNSGIWCAQWTKCEYSGKALLKSLLQVYTASYIPSLQIATPSWTAMKMGMTCQPLVWNLCSSAVQSCLVAWKTWRHVRAKPLGGWKLDQAFDLASACCFHGSLHQSPLLSHWLSWELSITLASHAATSTSFVSYRFMKGCSCNNDAATQLIRQLTAFHA